MKIYILSISDSDKHFAPLIEEYIKRLPKNLLQIINLKPYKSDNHQQCITKDTENMISRLKDISWLKIMLSKDWIPKTTEQLVEICNKSLQDDHNIIYIIWWPYGLDEAIVRPYISEYISFGKITVPHGLAKLIIVEQIYRVETIRSGKDYHY